VDDPDFVPSTSKKGKKKKKRSAIANAANPHHVKNCEFCWSVSALRLAPMELTSGSCHPQTYHHVDPHRHLLGTL
jgi:hypothetical protein